VLTWRSPRYEGALRYRSLDLKEATVVTRDTVVQNGTQGMYHIPVLYCRQLYVTRHSPCSPFRLGHRPSASSSLAFPSTLVMMGKRGTDARVVHAQVFGMARYTRQAPLCVTCCNTDTLFVTQPRPCMPSSIRTLQFSTCLSRLVLTASIGQQCYHCWKRRERLLDTFTVLEGQITVMYRIAAEQQRSRVDTGHI
jgi:hypothetical protein